MDSSKPFKWSGREDSNLRPPAPHADALARLRYVPNTVIHFIAFLQKVKMENRTNSQVATALSGIKLVVVQILDVHSKRNSRRTEEGA